ncbi:hypothetical protein A8C32_10475 [Flavivirga aquatica]|uniref:Response regulatory domain-containing protein n=1 Tax=Flavivirga aquatica TaxID=1849968 RepID=A0A1E5TCS3_9FLAO|nr:response regulator [Flavivirga aquatica]OEK09150.1 hypothetical protein A8C32_10475 [Flavivirga aquatica]
MRNPYRVLLIDDHPLIIDAYKRALEEVALKNNLKEFVVFTADSCESAILKINKRSKEEVFDLVFLDLKLKPSKNNKILNGEDLGVLIRKKLKGTKIIVSTSFSDSYLVSCVFKSINPEAFLIKSDLTKEVLIEAVKTVVFDLPFYSKTIINIFRKQAANDFVIDNIDRKILHELSNGTKMNELPKLLPLSIAALERRKRILKDVFNVEGKGDRSLLLLAQEKGFI